MADGGSALTRVFVYGTLKLGFYNHYVLSRAKGAVPWSAVNNNGLLPVRARFVGRAESMPGTRLHLSVGGPWMIPYLQRSPDDCDDAASLVPIRGEVYEVDATLLAALDQLEGVPHHYQRETVMALVAAETVLECCVYVKTEPDLELLAKPHIREYDLAVHALYTPPPMRDVVGPWKQHMDKVKAQASLPPVTSTTPAPTRPIPLLDDFAKLVEDRCSGEDGPPRVLEVGCGASAPVCARLAARSSKAAELVALDFAEAQATRAREVLPEGVRVLCDDALGLGHAFPIRHFDFIACLGLLADVPPELHLHALRTQAAACKSGGVLYIDAPDAAVAATLAVLLLDANCVEFARAEHASENGEGKAVTILATVHDAA